jgi:hypothetical protein
MPELPWRQGIDYVQLEAAPESYKWWLNCLSFLRHLLAGEFGPSDRAILRCIVTDWVRKNPPQAPSSSRAWDGHAAALRTRVLSNALLQGEAWLGGLLEEHAAFLAAEENYHGHWNHGVDQSIALVDVALALERADLARVGADRLVGALSTVVDEQGATIEQAVGYQLYSYHQLAAAAERLKAVGVVSSVTERWRRMPLFLAHATRPDGRYFCLGDTGTRAAAVIPDTPAEYAASQGQRGPAPEQCVAVYEQAGYAFGRSGWGRRRPFAQESAFALRFGPQRAIHGHHDHTSVCYFSRGTEILRDGGFHGYPKDGTRMHLRSSEAHNVVTCTDPSRKRLNPHTVLSRRVVDPRLCHFQMSDVPSAGVKRRRDVVVFFEPECILVMDRLEADSPSTFQQVWHFGQQCELSALDGTSYRDHRLGFTVHQIGRVDHLEYLPEGSGRPLALCAGEAMFDTCFAPTLVATQRARVVEFLTVFAFDDANRPLQVNSQRDWRWRARRRWRISSATQVARVTELADGELACEVQPALSSRIRAGVASMASVARMVTSPSGSATHGSTQPSARSSASSPGHSTR